MMKYQTLILNTVFYSRIGYRDILKKRTNNLINRLFVELCNTYNALLSTTDCASATAKSECAKLKASMESLRKGESRKTYFKKSILKTIGNPDS